MSALAGKVAIITGASSGIGEATAEALARRGAKLILAARRAERLEACARCIAGRGGHAIAAPCDVSDRAAVQAMVSRAMAAFGRIDVLVNNAGVMPLAPMDRCRFEDWDLMIDINLRGALHVIGSVLPVMLDQGSGHIVNVGSVAGRAVWPSAAVYCGTKFALHAISEGLRMELAERAARDGNTIRVTVIAPGVVKTGLRDSITDPEARRAAESYYESLPHQLSGQDVAETIVAVLEAPPHVDINELVLRPTGQRR